MFPCADGSFRQEDHKQRQTLRHERVEMFDAGRVPSTLGEARGDPLQSARSDFLQGGDGVADYAEADRYAMEAREDFRSCLVFFFVATMSCPQWHAPKESSFPIPFKIHGRREANENRFGQVGREQYR